MQWLITIIQEWLIANGYLTQAYFDRGDPAANDYILLDFTLDNAWHDLDLSAIVPSSARCVSLHFQVRSTIVGKQFRVRPKGNANNINVGGVRSLVANLLYRADCAVSCDSNRFIQYRGDAVGWNFISLDVKGWWF